MTPKTENVRIYPHDMEVFLDRGGGFTTPVQNRVRSPEKEKTNFITEAGLNFEQRQTSQGNSS